jgi:hypothetical protein
MVVSADSQGYALIEYALKSEAEAAIAETNGKTFLEQVISSYVLQWC